MKNGSPLPPLSSVESVAVTPSRNDEATRADRLAKGGLIQCVAIILILIAVLITAP